MEARAEAAPSHFVLDPRAHAAVAQHYPLDPLLILQELGCGQDGREVLSCADIACVHHAKPAGNSRASASSLEGESFR